MFEKEKKKKARGCFKNSLLPLFVIVVVIILACITMFSHCDMSVLTQYKKVLNELQTKVTEQEMAPNAIKEKDYETLESDLSSFIQNNNDDEFFYEDHGFIYENITPENITFINSSLSLNKKTLACFLNCAIISDGVEGFYDEESGEQLFEILEITNLRTTDGITLITGVAKINLGIFKNQEEASSATEVVDAVNSEIYLTYTATFGTEVLSSEMRVNKLSDDSNDRLLSLFLVGTKVDNDKVILNQKLNSIMESLLNSLQELCDFWDLNYLFEDEYLILSTK
ncbi:MAG: hypothetical protein IJ837_02050 [Clostridia bacterium]|nr:hypothetical protein [Clostridia bacterium]